MAENQLLRFANGSLPNVISYAEWKNLPEVTKGFVSGIAKSANMNRVIAQGALAGYVMGQAIVNLLGKNATLESSTFYEDFLAALCKHIPGNVADASIPTAKLSERATKQDIENGTAMRVVCADVVKQYFDLICPPGMITFFHATDVPEGWLLCNGATVSRTTYSRLFAKIGTKYGAGDGSTTFALPNLDGRVLQGTTNTGNVGNYLEASLPNITTLEAQPVETRASVAFMDANNEAHLLTLEQLKTVQVEIIQNGQSAYQQKWALRTAIKEAQSKEDLEAIEIKFTAEDFSK